MKRLGSVIPFDADQLVDIELSLPDDCLPFSNGRAALAWLLATRPHFKSVLMCAYSCPALVKFFRREGLSVGFFDIGASCTDMGVQRGLLKSPCLTLLPALLGILPSRRLCSEYNELPADLTAYVTTSNDLMVIDAMHTAFAHLEVSDRWVLSGPRKTTGLPDGAILRVPVGWRFRSQVMALPEDVEARTLKRLAQRSWLEGNDEIARSLNDRAELQWPTTPHRMSESSLERLAHLDVAWHSSRRQVNYTMMVELLGLKWDELGLCVPFACPIFVNEPSALQERLRRERIYATRLFHDCEHSAELHPRTHKYAEHLLLLPIDQRCGEQDIERIAKAVIGAGREEEKCQLLQRVAA